MTPALQERHHDYVLGPNQDSRLASVAGGALIKGITLQLDPDAPFSLRARALRQSYTAELDQDGLQFLKVRWAGPTGDYRQQDLVLQAVEMANYGQGGNPKPVYPPVVYPANGVITLDLENTGSSAISNLTFYWRGVKLFPWGSVPAYTYPPRFAGLSFVYRQSITALQYSETRLDQIFTVRPDADFVLRAGQFTAPQDNGQVGGGLFAETFLRLKDFNKKPYSNDFVHTDILFGCGSFPATIPLGPTPSFLSPFATGPAQPGLFYPELYVPRNHQLLFDIKRSESVSASNADCEISWIGSKVFQR